MPRRPRDHWYATAVDAAQRSARRIWTRSDLQQLHEELTAGRVIPRSTTLEALTMVLIERGCLRSLELEPVVGAAAGATGEDRPARRSIKRLVWGETSPFEVALTLRPRSYLSHGSAAVVNGLADPADRPVYVNQEQSPKPSPSAPLEQGAIDRAFRNRARTSTYAFRYDGTTIVLLSGKHTGDFGVAEITYGDGPTLRATGLARTLVDIAVRPAYAGGTAAVLDAYRCALAREPAAVLVEGLTATLDVLAHVYPYHQAVGFYLERAGAAEAATAPLKTRGISYNFYLDYAMDGPAHEPAWRVYYPRTLG